LKHASEPARTRPPEKLVRTGLPRFFNLNVFFGFAPFERAFRMDKFLREIFFGNFF